MTDQFEQPPAGSSGAEPPPAGAPFAAEALRIVASVQDWARRSFPEGNPAPDGHSGSECQWCPLCQFVAVLRGERPEVTERVADAGAAVAGALRAVFDAAGSGTARNPPDRPPAPRVHRIDLDGPDDLDDLDDLDDGG